MVYDFDCVVIGAGMYGMYAAKILGERGLSVAVLEKDSRPFTRASYVNQARVHLGQHYPRSKETALQSIKYFERFVNEFSLAINKEFTKIYSISKDFSMVDANHFREFQKDLGLKFEEVDSNKFYKPGMVEASFTAGEYSFDASIVQAILQNSLNQMPNVKMFFGVDISDVERSKGHFVIKDSVNQNIFRTSTVFNVTYAGINQIIDKFGFDRFDVKYELCEMILCDVTDNIKDYGLTVMDGKFFSVMPFGLTGHHSLSAVEFTPHKANFSGLPKFDCQKNNPRCSKTSLDNCNNCQYAPRSNWEKMYKLAKSYLNDDVDIFYKKSIFAMKTVLLEAEENDARPTIIRKHSTEPNFITIFSGKINALYEIEEAIDKIFK